MKNKIRVSVLGDGGWGTALALVNLRRGNDVMLWSAFPDYAKIIEKKHENIKYLPGIKLPTKLKITSDLKQAVEFADILILSIPTQFLRGVVVRLKNLSYQKKILVSTAKGIELGTCLRPTQIIREVLGRKVSIVALSGPSHAEEVALNIPTLVVAASESQKAAETVQHYFRDARFRIYIQKDLIGVELGGAIKNVIAVAAGVCDGFGFGDNTKSGLVTRSICEMIRLGVKLGAKEETFFGLSGLGDLITTSFSKHGRNLFVGREIGKGRKVKDILAGMATVAEGVATVESVHQICVRENVDMPILREVYEMLFKNKKPSKSIETLLSRTPGSEWKLKKIK